ncbi:hypothetical protein FACS1894217_07590 [Clostridia bacterium]|nr:hypothetical protein FACS1894217_07590 [Clostridia bacterium]
MESKKFKIGGMTCINCQNRIEKALKNTPGVFKATVSHAKGTAEVLYRPDKVSPAMLEAVVKKTGYEVLPKGSGNLARGAGTLLIVLALYMIAKFFGLTDLFGFSATAEENTGLFMLFVVGLLTSVHCVAMCGGINLSQCVPTDGKASLRPGLLYNLGRVAAYTIVGVIVGAIGSVLSFSVGFQGMLKLIAGLFMIVMGANMMGLLLPLNRFIPKMPRLFKGSKSNSPLIVGLLNGLMPCGPLQAMQLYALATGSPIKGGLAMLLFSLGTVPLMFGMSALSSVLGKRFAKNAAAIGAALVVVFGISMLSQGFTLAAFRENAPGSQGTGASEATVVSTLTTRGYPAITVKVGEPVKWVINVPKGTITGCNSTLIIPEYGIRQKLKVGENIIEFTPTETGQFQYSCWMGMIRSTITVEA